MSTVLVKKLVESMATDGCDQRACPARAVVAVQTRAGGWLTFCGHHYDANEALKQIEATVLDTRTLSIPESRGGEDDVTSPRQAGV